MNTIRIYIQDGLVQHVHGNKVRVRIVDLDTEGSPAADTQRLAKGDIKGLPDGLGDRRRAFITTWHKDGETSRP